MLQPIGSQRVKHNLVTEQQQPFLKRQRPQRITEMVLVEGLALSLNALSMQEC